MSVWVGFWTMGISQTRQKISQYEDLAMQLTTPGMKMMEMQGMGPSIHASAKMVMDEKKEKCVLVGTNLSPLPKGKTYQLWGMKGDQAISVGTFGVDAHGCALYSLPLLDVKNFDKFAVTMEPAGGVAQPSGAMHLLGNIG